MSEDDQVNFFFGIVSNDSYLTQACSHGFQCLYDNESGAVEAMSEFWRLVATTYKQYSNVLG